MTDIFEEHPDENEQYENLDEFLDEEDLPGHGGAPASEGGRDLGTDLIVDQLELREVGAELDDPERMAILDGGMDDPDGAESRGDTDDLNAGWDVDPVSDEVDDLGDVDDLG